MEPDKSPAAGEQLRRMRCRIGITTRDVDQRSREIATVEDNLAYAISHARLVQIENGQSTPSIHKLFTLSAIYGVKLSELLALYIGVERASRYHLESGLDRTHLMEFEPPDRRHIDFPVRIQPGSDAGHTNLFSRIVEAWGEVPVELLQRLNVRKGMWGYIGLSDYTMYPLLRPGSLVQIEPTSRGAGRTLHQSEFDRPIYFVETRQGYVCSWCEVRKDRLMCVPHPLAPVGIREFAHPREAEIIGRVTAVAARLVNPVNPHAVPDTPRLAGAIA